MISYIRPSSALYFTYLLTHSHPVFFFFFLILLPPPPSSAFFFLNDPATPEIYPLSLPDALPISSTPGASRTDGPSRSGICMPSLGAWAGSRTSLSTCAASPPANRSQAIVSASSGKMDRSEEHTSELQSHLNLVCRLLLEKKNKQN